MPELEFLPEKTKRVEFGDKKGINPGVLFLIVSLVLYGGFLFYNGILKSKIQELDAAFTSFNQSRDRAKETRLNEVQEKLSRTQALLDEHVLWSAGFKKVQKLTLSSVQMQSLTASLPELKFEFRAFAPNLTSIAKQGANFLGDESIKDVSINQIKVLTSGKTEFVVRLTFDKNNFLR